MCKNFPFFGRERGYQALDKIKQLVDDKSKAQKETVSWLYSALTILDAKANGLMRVNSLFITLATAFLGAARLDHNPLKISHDQVATAVLGMALLILSTILCFMIVRVNWKFLSHVVKPQDQPDYDFDNEAKRLANVVDNRTHYYFIGWFLTLIVMAFPVLLWLHFPPMIWLLGFFKNYIPAPG
jgi:hypothetical protein